MIHIITPFTRTENKNFYIEKLKNLNIYWHVLLSTDHELCDDVEIKLSPWILVYKIDSEKLETFKYKNVEKINNFIKNDLIIDHDYYFILNDDDWLEDNFIEKLKKYNDDILFISMKRGHTLPHQPIQGTSIHGVNTLYPYKNVGRGSIGFEQMIVKGHILKQMTFIDHGESDGFMAEWLQKNFDVKYIQDIFIYFNYLEPGRWNTNIKENIIMETITQRFERIKKEPRDISEHLDTLYKYALECNTIVELGINEGISTTAFCLAVQKFPEKIFYNYDVHTPKMFEELIEMCKIENVKMNFTIADDRNIEIPKCDLLFIDTLHTGKQISAELNLHAKNCNKYIIMHDTETFKYKGVDGTDDGMKPPIDKFLFTHPEWVVKEHFTNCNGLTILEKI